MTPETYVAQDATGLAQGIRDGAFDRAEVLAAARARADALEPTLNVFVERFDAPDADPDAQGPFAGVPFAIKDLVLHTGHTRIEYGSRLAAGVTIPYDTELMRRFRAAGLVTIGRTTTPEFGYCPTTESVFSGPTRNPWDTSRSPGGSSGGSAAAVAAGIVPVAHANDGGGSIRIPAAACGLVGLKPTRGRTPAGPDYFDPLCGLGIEFALSRSVRDTAALLDAVAGPMPGDGYVIPPPVRRYVDELGRDPGRLRIAFSTTTFAGAPVAPELAAAVTDLAHRLERLGFDVFEGAPTFDHGAYLDATHDIWTTFVAQAVDGIAAVTGRTPGPGNLEATTLACAAYGRTRSAGDLLAAFDTRNRVSRDVATFFEGADLLLTPTVSRLPPPLGEIDADDASLDARGWTERVFDFAAFTGLFNFTGQPGISLPLARTDTGLPIGLHFAARLGDEATLIRVAAALEAEMPWPLVAPIATGA